MIMFLIILILGFINLLLVVVVNLENKADAVKIS